MKNLISGFEPLDSKSIHFRGLRPENVLKGKVDSWLLTTDFGATLVIPQNAGTKQCIGTSIAPWICWRWCAWSLYTDIYSPATLINYAFGGRQRSLWVSPIVISPLLEDLIAKMMAKPKTRLGCKLASLSTEFTFIKNHPYFNGKYWDQ